MDDLRIEFEWLGRQSGSALERAFYADIGLAVGDEWLTRLEDLEARTVSDYLRGSVYHLATWFAANWWRLRWEPETRDWTEDADWRIAHSIASAGGGYVWPNVIFASDGSTLTVASHPRPKAAAFEPIRYLNHIDALISVTEFERKVDAFMANVLSRLHAVGIKDDTLPILWSEVLGERRDPEATLWRRIEAICGYDPDDAPAETIEMLIDDKAGLGQGALEEVAAEGRHSIAQVLQPILDRSKFNGKPTAGGFRGNIPELATTKKHSTETRPWQHGARLAKLARKSWDFGTAEPIRNHALADLLGVHSSVFASGEAGQVPIPFALRTGSDDELDIYIDSCNSTTRRFAVSRLIGDHLWFDNRGRLVPATHTKTARQKLQRSFAQEFLCPIDALLDRLPTPQPNEDDISDAAEHFHVSPLMVRTTLVNHHELGREALTWPD